MDIFIKKLSPPPCGRKEKEMTAPFSMIQDEFVVTLAVVFASYM